MDAAGTAPIAAPLIGTNPGPAWHVKGTGDFNGDGHADILWQNDNGSVATWLMDAAGTAPIAAPLVGTNPGPAWHVKGTGDFNGDGHADILWQNDNGSVATWLMDAAGTTPIAAPCDRDQPGAELAHDRQRRYALHQRHIDHGHAGRDLASGRVRADEPCDWLGNDQRLRRESGHP